MFVAIEPRDYFDAEWLEARLAGRVSRRCLPRVPGGCEVLEVRLDQHCPKLTADGLCSVWGEEAGQPAACRLAVVLGDECRESIRRLRPVLWTALVADGLVEAR
jgi:hypothetical protein